MDVKLVRGRAKHRNVGGCDCMRWEVEFRKLGSVQEIWK